MSARKRAILNVRLSNKWKEPTRLEALFEAERLVEELESRGFHAYVQEVRDETAEEAKASE